LNKEIKVIENEILNLRVVKNNMDSAVNKFKQGKNTKQKRIDAIKLQIEYVKNAYKIEVDEYNKIEEESFRQHKQLESLKDYCRNIEKYLKDKAKHGS